jgi:uncharacterized membrane protein
MNNRPHAVSVLSWVFIATGVVGLAYHFTGFNAQLPFQYEILWIALVRLLAIVCGVYMLRGRNWARWLTVVWIAYHVVLSAFHTLSELAIHTLLLVVSAYILFRPRATEYFRGTRL